VIPLPTQRLILGVPGQLLFGLLILFAVLAFFYSASRRIRLLLALSPEPRFDRIGTRIGKTLEYAFAQKRMFRDLYAGVFHIFLFGGFVVLTVRTIALVVEGLVPGFILLPGRAGDAYTLVKDIFEVLVLVGVAMAVARRAFARPKRLDLTLDAWLILFLIGVLISADLVRGGRARGAESRRRERLGARGPASSRGSSRECRRRRCRRFTRPPGGCTCWTSSSSATTSRTPSTSTS
jgi:hypothetical protein